MQHAKHCGRPLVNVTCSERRDLSVWCESLEEASLDDARLVVSELTAALLLGPEFAADSLPAVSCGTGETIVLATARARAGRAAV